MAPSTNPGAGRRVRPRLRRRTNGAGRRSPAPCWPKSCPSRCWRVGPGWGRIDPTHSRHRLAARWDRREPPEASRNGVRDASRVLFGGPTGDGGLQRPPARPGGSGPLRVALGEPSRDGLQTPLSIQSAGAQGQAMNPRTCPGCLVPLRGASPFALQDPSATSPALPGSPWWPYGPRRQRIVRRRATGRLRGSTSPDPLDPRTA
jgi:hypothetical protein